MCVTRLSANRARVSGTPESPGTSSRVSAGGKVCWLLKEKPGDHVIEGVMFTGEGVRPMLGKVCEIRPFPMSCDRLPPMLSVPQSNCLLKFSCDTKLAVATNGLT